MKWPEVATASEYVIEIASDREFKNVLVTTKTSDPKFIWRYASAGRYFVRVAIVDSVGQQSAFSNVSELNVKYLRPQIAKNPPQTRIIYQGDPPKQEFSWAEVPFCSGYDLEIYQEGKKDPILNQRVAENHFDYGALKTGNYQWRVRAVDEKGNSSSWSEKKSFALKKELPFANLTDPPTQKELKVEKSSYRGVTFKWEPALGATEYRFILSKDRELKNIIEEENVQTNEYQYKISDAGEYFWTVESRDDEDTSRRLAPTVMFRFDYVPEREEIRLDSPSEKDTVYTYNPTVPMKFSWSKLNMEVNYLIEISQDSDFSEIKSKAQFSNSFGETSFPDYGSYYWRVRTETPVKPAPDLPPTIIKSNVFELQVDRRKNFSLQVAVGIATQKLSQSAELVTSEIPSGNLNGSSSAVQLRGDWWPTTSWWGLAVKFMTTSFSSNFLATDGSPDVSNITQPNQEITGQLKARWTPNSALWLTGFGSLKQLNSVLLYSENNQLAVRSSGQLAIGGGGEIRFSPNYGKMGFAIGYEINFSLDSPVSTLSSIPIEFQYHFSHLWVGVEVVQNNLTTSRLLFNPATAEYNNVSINQQYQLGMVAVGFGW